MAMALPAALLLMFGAVDVANYYRAFNAIQTAVNSMAAFGSNIEMRAGMASPDTQLRVFDWYKYSQLPNHKTFKLAKVLVQSGVAEGVTPIDCNPPAPGWSCTRFFNGVASGTASAYNVNVLELVQIGLNSLDATMPGYKLGCSGAYCTDVKADLTDPSGVPSANPSHVYASASTEVPLLTLLHQTVDVSVASMQRIERQMLDNVNVEVNYSPVGGGTPPGGDEDP